MILPSGLFDRITSLRASGYTGTMQLNWKEGHVVDWSFTVREKSIENSTSKESPFFEQVKLVAKK